MDKVMGLGTDLDSLMVKVMGLGTDLDSMMMKVMVKGSVTCLGMGKDCAKEIVKDVERMTDSGMARGICSKTVIGRVTWTDSGICFLGTLILRKA